jgi:signal transduction histidine kinase
MLIDALRLHERSVDITAAPVSLAPLFARLCRDNSANRNGARVGCCRRGALMKIEVYDTGMAIPSEKLSTVFEAFHRLDSTRADGLGLGLFVVRRAVDLLGHNIEVRSRWAAVHAFPSWLRSPPVPPSWRP